MSFANIQLTRGSTMINGWMMEDGTFQFVMDGKMRYFNTLMDAWNYWIENK